MDVDHTEITRKNVIRADIYLYATVDDVHVLRLRRQSGLWVDEVRKYTVEYLEYSDDYSQRRVTPYPGYRPWTYDLEKAIQRFNLCLRELIYNDWKLPAT